MGTAKNVEFSLFGNPIRHSTMLPDATCRLVRAQWRLAQRSHSGQKLFLVCSHEVDEFLVAGIFVGARPQHHLR